MTTAECAWGTTRKPETTFREMLKTIRDRLSDLVTSDDEQDGECKAQEEEDT